MPYANRDRHLAAMRTWVNQERARRRAVAIAYLGGVCARCSSTDRLEFHHRDENSKVNNISRLWTHRPATIWSELDKCELLCHQCHFQITYYGDDKEGRT